MDFIKIIQALKGRIPFFGRHSCNICGHRLRCFIPYNAGRAGVSTLPNVLSVIGSDTINFECPWCGAHDRERHLLMYMRVAGLFDALPDMSVLHFAPERRLSRLIAAKKPAGGYIKCDLYPNAPDVECIDMQATPYSDMSFDLVIASHILEHVADDTKALKEIYRILKPEGYAILQTPFSPKLHVTWSDKGVDTEQARLIAYGQEDHVRLFGRDIFDRFSLSGLTPSVLQHDEVLSIYDSNQYGVNRSEPFFLFKKDKKMG